MSSLDQLLVVKDFEILRPLMADRRLKASVRLLYVFGMKGSEVIFVTNDDVVYGFGHNIFGRLGLGLDDNQQVAEPTRNEWLSGQSVVDIVNGYSFCMARTRSGQLYAWGENSYGQLANGNTDSSNWPQLIQSLVTDGLVIVDISAGNTHTLMLTSDGRVLSAGRNDLGQLGDKSVMSRSTPVAVHLPSMVSIVSISCGKNHSLAVTDTGRVYVWGFNGFGQLGRPMDLYSNGVPKPFTHTPELICTGGLDSTVVVKAMCGSNHTLLLSSDGLIYSFGASQCGQVGNGSRNPQFTPICICPDLRFKDIVTDYIYGMCVAVTADDRYLMWGYRCGPNQFQCTPKPLQESPTDHTIYDIYAKYGLCHMTYKTVVFNDLPSLVNGSAVSTDHFNVTEQLDNNYDIESQDLRPMIEFSKYLSNAFDNQLVSDLVFVFKDNRIYCHKSILKIRNKQFWHKCEELLAKTNSIDNEIHIKSYSYESFKAFGEFLYAMKPNITSKMVCKEVSKLATIYGEPILQELCDRVVNELKDDKVVIDLSNICQLYEKSINEQLIDLEVNCIEFAKNNFKLICKLDSFHDMSDSLSKQLMISMFE